MALRQFLYLRKALLPSQRPTSLKSSDIAWAFHSESQASLLEAYPGIVNNPGYEWSDLFVIGVGYWFRHLKSLQVHIEKVAKNVFQRTQLPLKAALFYVALRRLPLLCALFRSVGDQRMALFFGNDFSDSKNQTAALKNAYALLGKQRFEEAACFFILGNQLQDAVKICIRNLKDPQLGLVLCRLYLNDEGVLFNTILRADLLVYAQEECDPYLTSILLWQLKEYPSSLNVLINHSNRGCVFLK